MSSKTRKTASRCTRRTGSARPLRAVPDPSSEPTAGSTGATTVRTDTEDKVWAALHACPNSTTADLAVTAKIGKSTAAKILARWAGDGSVTRTAGIAEGGRRAADRWAITDPDTRTVSDTEPTVTEPTEAEPTKETSTPKPQHRDNAADGSGKSVGRLAAGALRGMVEDYLRDHPGEEFSPNAIGTALQKSSGAVNNALEKLVLSGCAVKTREAPKRFALAAEQAASDPGTK